MQRPQLETVVLKDILIAEELSQRSPRPPNWQAEVQAIQTLARQMANHSETMLQSLVEMALELCQAGTAGVSLLETTPDGEEIFRKTVSAGELAQYIGDTTPRNFSLCGVCLDRGSPQLYSHPERYFTYLQAANTPFVEGLVLPLIADNHALGTIWILSHDEQRHFDSEDVRVMTILADFTVTALLLNQQQTGKLVTANATLEAEIVERKQVELERERFLAVGSDLQVITGSNGYFQWVSPTFERTLGWTQNEMTAHPWTEFVHPDDISASVSETDSLFLGNETFTFENRYRHKDGSYRWFLWHTQPYLEEQVIYGVAVDITQSKQAEEALRESEELKQRILESSKDCIKILTLNSEIVYISPGGLDILEIDDPTSILNTVWADFWQGEDYENAQAAIAVATLGNTGQFQGYLPTAKGTPKWWDTIITPVRDASSQVVQLVAISRDITEAKRSEAERQQAELALRAAHVQLESALAAGVVYTWRWNIPADRVVVNAAFAHLFGVDSAGATTEGLPIEFFINSMHESDRTRVWTAIQQALETGEEYTAEYRVHTATGEERWLTARGRVEYDAAGKPVAFPGALADITKRKRAEEDRDRFFQLSRDMLAIVNTEGYFLQANPVWTETLGYTAQELTAQPYIEFVHPDDQAATQAEAQTLAQGIPTVAFENRYRCRDGSYRWISWSVAPFIEQEILYCVARDITDRKRAEAELQTQRQILETVVNYLPNSAAIVRGRDLTFQLVNPAYQAIAPGKDMLGKTIQEVWPETQPFFGERCRHVLETGEPYQAVDEAFEIRRSSDQPLELAYFSWSMHRINLPNEDGWGILITIWETTERKSAEEMLSRTLQKLNFHIENSPVAVIEWDQNFRVSRWSSDAERIFGWRAEEVMGKAFSDWRFVFDEDLERLQRIGQDLAQGIEQRNVVHNRNYTKSGEIVHCEWYNSTLLDASGRLVSILSLALDVSDRIRLQAEREQILQQEQAARETAERANRIKDEFLAVLSHELRSPLNPILGWTKLLQNRKLDPDRQAEALKTIERNAKLQSQLIEDLLDISRIMQGKLSLKPAPVSLTFVISAAVETVRLAAEAKNIQILLDLTTAIAPVSGDAVHLQQVVWNLLSNAVKFTPNGGQVTVELRQLDQLAQIRVLDTGKGINPQFLPYVFEYFRQEDSSTTRKFGGLGLGLAIVRQIVELHGGTVKAESLGENQGATFIVQLPIIQQVISTVFEPSDAKSENIEAPLANLQILVVDDDNDTREFQSFVLEQGGAQVIAVASGLEALQVLDKFIPDVLVSDVGMAEMDGYMLIQQILSHPTNQGGKIPAIALTAYATDFDRQKALQAGFQSHITKPVEPEVLVRTIVNLLEHN